MAIEFHCTGCQNLLRTTDDKAGRQAKCPHCGTSITVPLAAAAAPHADAFDLGDTGLGEPESAVKPPSLSSAGDSGDMKRCPMCGEMIKAAAIRCRFCGEDLSGGRLAMAPPTSYLKPHRGTTVLVLSILGWAVCCVFAIPAYIMAQNDLKEMKDGLMDPTGEGTTKAAKIISLVQFCFVGVMFVFYAIMFAVGIATGEFQ